MSADTLRRAAALMREQAENVREVCPEPWTHTEHLTSSRAGALVDADGCILTQAAPVVQAHIASWHPAVALAVADWLDATAEHAEVRGLHLQTHVGAAALAVARAYLGERS